MIIDNISIEWLGHASFKIKTDGSTIYIDPFDIKSEEKADIILITHGHYDHCSINDIRKIAREGTVIAAPPDCLSKVSSINKVKIIPVEPNKSYDINSLKIETVPAYNINKKFHPKENDWVGYVLNIQNKRIYHAGDTDAVPEMMHLQNIDIAMLPIGGTYTMDVKEAAKAANMIKPKILIPMHYNKIQGTEAEPEELKQKLMPNIRMETL